MMNVTYYLYEHDKDKPVRKYINHMCFYMLFETKWDYMKLRIKSTKCNKPYVKFWKSFILKLHPDLEINRNFITIPYLGRGKTLILCTAIRYLWESSNHYQDIPKMCKLLVDKYPNIDPFVALTIASSNTQITTGWGHSLVVGIAEKLITTSDFDNYTGETVHNLFNPNSQIYYNIPGLKELRQSKENDLDLQPILKHFNYEQ